MFRLPDQAEALRAMELMDHAVREGRIVEVSFLKRYSIGEHNGRTRVPDYARKRSGAVWFEDSLNGVFGECEMLEAWPTHWTVEPVLVDLTEKDHPVAWSRREWTTAPYADVIRHTANGPRARLVRLDRVVVRNGSLALRVTDRPARFRDTALDPTISRLAASSA